MQLFVNKYIHSRFNLELDSLGCFIFRLKRRRVLSHRVRGVERRRRWRRRWRRRRRRRGEREAVSRARREESRRNQSQAERRERAVKRRGRGAGGAQAVTGKSINAWKTQLKILRRENNLTFETGFVRAAARWTRVSHFCWPSWSRARMAELGRRKKKRRR